MFRVTLDLKPKSSGSHTVDAVMVVPMTRIPRKKELYWNNCHCTAPSSAPRNLKASAYPKAPGRPQALAPNSGPRLGKLEGSSPQCHPTRISDAGSMVRFLVEVYAAEVFERGVREVVVARLPRQRLPDAFVEFARHRPWCHGHQRSGATDPQLLTKLRGEVTTPPAPIVKEVV